MSSLIGQAIGKYSVVSEIGRGGMAVVYRVRDTVLDRDVALKLMAPHLAWDPQFVDRFMAEARAVARLKHPNIVVIYDVGKYQERPFLAMEYIAGHPLSALMQKGRPLPPPYVAAIISQVAAALDHAHAQGIIHRDIKPGNVMVGTNNHITLTDFGVARALESTHLTQTGTLLGTPAYMSPEQVLGKEATAASDQYSLAIVTYEMLAGVTPFQGDTSVVILHNQVYTPPPPLRHFNPNLASEYEAVLGKALAKTPGERYATNGQFAARLAAVAGTATGVVAPVPPLVARDAQTVLKGGSGSGRPPGPRTPLPDTSGSGGRARWPWLALALVVAIVILGGVFLAGRSSSRSQALAPAFAPPAGPTEVAIPIAFVVPTALPTSPPTMTVAPSATVAPTSTPRPDPTRTATTGPTLAPTTQPTAAAAVAEPPPLPPCSNDMQVVAHVRPADNGALTAGQTFAKVWSIKNTGTCPWVEDYQVAYEGGDQMGARPLIRFNYRMDPGQTDIVTVDGLRAPAAPGTYGGSWRLRDANGNAFGEPLLVRIAAQAAPPTIAPPTLAPLAVAPPTIAPPTATLEPPAQASIIQFWADDDTVEPNSPDAASRCTLLKWRVEGVSSMLVMNARTSELVPNGSLGSTYPGEVRTSRVCPASRTTYILKITSRAGSQYDWGTVEIKTK